MGRRNPGGTGWLLADISLELNPWERLILAGPSGSGKTLLLRAMALLDPLDTGEIRWLGRTVRPDEVPSFRCQVIYLHQRPALMRPNVEECLRQPYELRLHRNLKFDRERIVRLLKRLGRDETFLQKAARDLSGGEIQITALLRALQLDPSVLLLDEPTAALDAATAEAVEELLIRWTTPEGIPDAERGGGPRPVGRALVWVSHDPGQHLRMGTATIEIRGGRLVGRVS